MPEHAEPLTLDQLKGIFEAEALQGWPDELTDGPEYHSGFDDGGEYARELLRQIGHDKQASVEPQVYYHVAPYRDRESVRDRGIDWRYRDQTRDWRTDDDDFESYPMANYITTDLDKAREYARMSGGDIWRVDPTGHKLWADVDSDWAVTGRPWEQTSYRTSEPITPDRLTLHEPHPDSPAPDKGHYGAMAYEASEDHDELVRKALARYYLAGGWFQRHLEREQADEEEPELGRFAQAIAWELRNRSRPNDVHLYRGGTVEPSGIRSWTTDPEKARMFSSEGHYDSATNTFSPQRIDELPAGQGRGLRLADYLDYAAPDEWLIDHGFQPNLRQAKETPAQEIRRWQELWPSHGHETIHSLPNGWSVRHNQSIEAINRVGEMMRNCWQGVVPENLAQQHEHGWSYHSLHDERGIPRVAFYLHNNPWNREAPEIKQALGMRNAKPDRQHLDLLHSWADTQGISYVPPIPDGALCPQCEYWPIQGDGPCQGCGWMREGATLDRTAKLSWEEDPNDLSKVGLNYPPQIRERLDDNLRFALWIIHQPQNRPALLNLYKVFEENLHSQYLGYTVYRTLHETLRDQFPSDFDWVHTDWSVLAKCFYHDLTPKAAPGASPVWQPGDPKPEYDPGSGWTEEDHNNFYDVEPQPFDDEHEQPFNIGDWMHYSLIDHEPGDPRGSIFGPVRVGDIDDRRQRFRMIDPNGQPFGSNDGWYNVIEGAMFRKHTPETLAWAQQPRPPRASES